MNLADLDRPETADDDADQVETVTVADVEGTAEAGTAGTETGSGEKEKMREPEGQHYFMDAKIGEKELLAFLFGHNYRQPLMLLAVLVAVIWPIMVLVRNDNNLFLALALAAIILLALPFSTWSRGRKAARTNPSYQQIFHYMVDEWGLHLELEDKCIDLEWNKVYKCVFMKTVTVIYTSKVNAFLLPTVAMGEQKEEINAFIRKMNRKK